MVLSGFYFDVYLTGKDVELRGGFSSVSGLDMEVEYDVYNEGGSNFPRYFFKATKPQNLVLEHGIITSADSISALMERVNAGAFVPLSGTVTLRDSFHVEQRTWAIVGAHLQKYVGPQLNSNQPQAAVSRIELLYNGCF